MKLYIPPHDLVKYWWRTRRHYQLHTHPLEPRWQHLHGEFPQQNSRGVFFSACDVAYYELYGENYLDSIAASGGGQSIHLHIYDADDALLRDASRAARRRGVRLTATRDVTFDGQLYSKYLFAAGRFVLLPQLLRECASPVICTDIDVLVRRSFDSSVAALAQSDVSLHLRPKNSLPWRKVLASTVIAMPTVAAQHYFESVAATLAETLRTPVNHHVDQIVLFLAYRAGRASASRPVRFAPMAKSLIDWDFGDGSLIWNAKGPERKPDYLEAVKASRQCPMRVHE